MTVEVAWRGRKAERRWLLNRRTAGLQWDGVLLEEAASRFSTPLYLYSAATMLEALAAYERAFSGIAAPDLLCLEGQRERRLAASPGGARGRGRHRLGNGARRGASRGVPARADRLRGRGQERGRDASRRSGPASGTSTRRARTRSSASPPRARGSAGRIRVSLRVNPDIDARSHPYISTGLRENKFGVDIERGPRHPAAGPGAGGHRGGGAAVPHRLADPRPAPPGRSGRGPSRPFPARLLAEGFRLETLDLGGGLGVDYDGKGSPALADLAAAVLPGARGPAPHPAARAGTLPGRRRGRASHPRALPQAER